ncbi:DUF4192 family protein [Alloscardovia criceti]|uniref:DUF4192 family protein n=1 Tax=Alloscardovia criceti TaxID=356828 RepID=UPI00035D214A|nr:DUF4192 family protein [Alloscardovia criceti]
MNTQTHLDALEIARLQAEFQQERDAAHAKKHEIYQRWFGDLCADLAEAMNETTEKTPPWDEAQLYRVIVGMNTFLAFRDIFILISMAPLTELELVAMITHPFASKNAQLIKNLLRTALTKPHSQPDEQRFHHALRIFDALSDVCPSEYCKPIYAICAYLHWWAGRMDKAKELNDKALALDECYSLALIVEGALRLRIYPAWCAKKLHGCAPGELGNICAIRE